MRNSLLGIVLVFISGVSFGQDMNVMSFNIRLNVASDSLNAWPHRKDLVASQIKYHDVHVLGVQEALHVQMTDLQERLPGFKFVGGGRDDGKTKGEYSAIFYDSTRLQVISSHTFWLSETPYVAGSKSWDAAITRIVTWAKFRDRKSKKQFFVFNTHFDHIGKEARKQSAKLILEQVKSITGNLPVIVMGDFNSKPTEEPYLILADQSNGIGLKDTRDISERPHYGPTGTFNGFGPKEVDNLPIDFIFVRGKWKVKKHATISQTWNGRFASDHFAVLTTLSL